MKKDLKIKVCGIKFPENREAISQMPVDLLGFIFYPPSKRYIGSLKEKELTRLFDTKKLKTGVFVNEKIDTVIENSLRFDLDYIQLHGNESPEYCLLLKKNDIKIIKVFRVNENFDFSITKNFKDTADYYLFDTKAELPGGTGKKYDWNILNEYIGDIPFFLSGGIKPEDSESIKKINHPKLFGVDLNSGFEIKPGLKDTGILSMFINELKKI